MTKFINWKKMPIVDYQRLQYQEIYRYHIYRFSDGFEAYSHKLPNKSSEYWNNAFYIVWDKENKCAV